jgi:hypothetical protein
VIDDPIKLRQALYEAEPFLTYLFKESQVERNNKRLLEALVSVRAALGMEKPTPTPKRVEVDEGPMGGHIELVSLIEHENGSCTASFEVNGGAAQLLTRVGLMKILNDAAKQYAEEQDSYANDKE